MNIIEKGAILASILGIAGYGTYHIFATKFEYQSKIRSLS